MQMRSAEEAQTSAMDHEPLPIDPAQDESLRSASGDRSGEDSPFGAPSTESTAEQETTLISAPSDPFAAPGVTVQPSRGQAPQARGQMAQAAGYAPQPMHATDSINATTLTFTPNTAAGVSYLFLWVSGVLVFFNERRNTYVRFHALQSTLFGAVATVVGVIGIVLAVLLMDLGAAWHTSVLSAIGLVCALLIPFTLVVVWWWLMVAAWTGHDVALPILGRYAKHYAAPEGQSLPTPHP